MEPLRTTEYIKMAPIVHNYFLKQLSNEEILNLNLSDDEVIRNLIGNYFVVVTDHDWVCRGVYIKDLNIRDINSLVSGIKNTITHTYLWAYGR